MVNDAYVENNKTKRQAWLIAPLALIIIGLIVLFGRPGDSVLTQPKILRSSAQGMLLELPVVATDAVVSWHAQWAPTSGTTRQLVLQALSQYAADYKQLRTRLEVRPGPGPVELKQLSQRIGDALALYDLGLAIPWDNLSVGDLPIENLPANFTLPDNGLLLICAEDDSELARRLLAALTPYLSGRVSVYFDNKITAQSMRLYLFGTPHFNDQGQAMFDSVAGNDVPDKDATIKQENDPLPIP